METQRPFVIGISSGPKTGKSSMASRIRSETRKLGPVISIDCNQYPRGSGISLVGWMMLVAAGQWNKSFAERPADWESAVDWLRRDMLNTEKAKCTFVYDHIEKLDDLYPELMHGWHNILNHTRDEPVFNGLGLVLIFDAASPLIYMHNSNGRTSRVDQRMRYFVPNNYTRGEVALLFRQVIVGGECLGGGLTDLAWAMFEGHPFLTHVYAKTYGDSMPATAAVSAEMAAESVLLKHLIPSMRSKVYFDEIDEFFKNNASTSSDGVCAGMRSSHTTLLQDTGLFFLCGFGANAVLRCTTWVFSRLMQALAKEAA